MKAPPVFIVGCGRSGTTAFGEVLGGHPQIAYLNEPKRLWTRVDPRTDVWTEEAPRRGRLDLYDVDPDTRSAVRKAFRKRTGPNRLLVEKTPINSFRVEYLRAVFPRARFIHLLRNGLDVARSIERWVGEGRRWYGSGGVKWDFLVGYARSQGLSEIVDRVGEDARLRGLLEWRLAVSHIRERLNPVDLEIRYERLVEEPEGTMQEVLGWLDLDEGGVDASVLARRSPRSDGIDVKAAEVAGDLLKELGYP